MYNDSVNRRDFVIQMGKVSAATGGLSLQACSDTEQPATEEPIPARHFNTTSTVADKPNIVWIVMDTARRDRFSCYGYPRETTPNIDALAAESTLFTNAISTSPWTVPTHASMFTGVYPSLHGTIGYTPHIDGAYPMLAEVLADAGYETAGYSNNPFVSQTFRFTSGFQTFMEPRTMLQQNNVDSGDKGALFTNNLINDWLGSRSGDDPFFLFVNYMEPHQPYWELQEGYLVEYTREQSLAAEIERIRQQKVFDYANVNAGSVSWTPRDEEMINAFYDANIRYLDMRIGELVGMLRERRILDNTLLIISSDHGENLYDHGMVDHMFCVYNSLINVPFMVRLPSAFQDGKRDNRLMQDVDIFPTIAELAGLSWDGRDHLQGESLLKPSSRQFALSEYCPFLLNTINVFINSPKPEFELHRLASLQKAVVTAEHKFIWRSFGESELYRPLDDPEETQNLIQSDPGTADRLHAMLRDWTASLPARPERQTPAGATPGIQLTPERERQLRDLGYI